MQQRLAIYGSPLSQPTRMVLWTAVALKLKYDFVKVDAAKGEHRTEEFKKLNPNEVFPVLVSSSSGGGGEKFVVWESNAICRYLLTLAETDEARRTAETLYPKDPKIRAHVDQYLEWKHSGLRTGCAGIVRRRVMRNLMKDISKHSMSQVFVEVKEEREARLLLESLAVIEAAVGSTDGGFLVNHTKYPTLADLAVFEEVEQLRMLPSGEEPPFGSNLARRFPNVVRWLERVRKTQPEYEATHKELIGAIAALEKQRNAAKAKL